MRDLIEQLYAQNRQPISIAFRLVKLGYFNYIEPALAYVDKTIGHVPFRRN